MRSNKQRQPIVHISGVGYQIIISIWVSINYKVELLRILSKIRNRFWGNGELNPFGVGQSISPIVEVCQ